MFCINLVKLALIQLETKFLEGVFILKNNETKLALQTWLKLQNFSVIGSYVLFETIGFNGLSAKK